MPVLRRRRHHDPHEVARWLGRVVNGWLNYYAVPTSSRFLRSFTYILKRIWLKALRRRSQRDRFSRQRLQALVDRYWPKPWIRHPWPERETVRFWWNRFGPMFAAEIRKRRVDSRSYSRWRWHLDEVLVRINCETRYLWRAVDHEGEVLEVLATKRRDRRAALKFLTRAPDSRPSSRNVRFSTRSFRPFRTLAPITNDRDSLVRQGPL